MRRRSGARQPPLSLPGVESFGSNALKCLLIIASRNERGLPTTISHLADSCDVNVHSIQNVLRTLKKSGAVEWESGMGATLRTAGNFALEFVPGVPECLREKISDRANRAAANAHTVGSPSVAGEPNLRAA